MFFVGYILPNISKGIFGCSTLYFLQGVKVFFKVLQPELFLIAVPEAPNSSAVL